MILRKRLAVLIIHCTLLGISKNIGPWFNRISKIQAVQKEAYINFFESLNLKSREK
jgi:hypothetical protein